jgi:NTE family protein
LRKCVDFGRLHENVHSGAVRGVGVFATQTSACNEVALQTTGARLFIDLTTDPEPGALSAVSAAAAPTALAAEHVMASAAIPVLFPAIRIEKPTHLSGLYADGSASPSKPIKTAIDLGASRIIYISGHAHRRRDAADISCDAANVELFELASASLYTQAAAAAAKDIKGLRRVNKMVREAVSAGVTLKSDQDKAYRYVKELLISPGRDCVPSLARSSLTTSVRGRDTAAGSAFSALYRLAYRFSPSGADEILSYLLFDADYLEKQIELGAVDARAALENDTELQSSTA